MSRRALIESETVKIILMVALIVILIGIIILVRKELSGGTQSFFELWRR